MSETQALYNADVSHTAGPYRIPAVTFGSQDDLDALLAEMRRGLLQVIRAIERYQEAKLTSSDKP